MSEEMVLTLVESADWPFPDMPGRPAPGPAMVRICGGRPALHPVMLETQIPLEDWASREDAVMQRNPDMDRIQATLLAGRQVLEEFEATRQANNQSSSAGEMR